MKKMKNKHNWKDNWFGSWLDIDIATNDYRVLNIKKSRRIAKSYDNNFNLSKNCKQYIEDSKDVTVNK